MGPSTAEQAWKGLAGFSLHPSWKRVLAEEVPLGGGILRRGPYNNIGV